MAYILENDTGISIRISKQFCGQIWTGFMEKSTFPPTSQMTFADLNKKQLIISECEEKKALGFVRRNYWF